MKPKHASFVLERFELFDGDGESVLDANFFDSDHSDKPSLGDNLQCGPQFTLVLGENGAGKSFLFKQMTKVFLSLYEVERGRKRIYYPFPKYVLTYQLNGHKYSIERESGKGLSLKIDDEDADLESLELPKKTLAVSFIVNDKFVFAKQDQSIPYAYLGVRDSSNNTYTSTIMKKTLRNVFRCIRKNRAKGLFTILSFLDFDTSLELTLDDEVFEVSKNSKCERILESDQIEPSNVRFSKNKKLIDFEDLSSGEKHILFAMSGMLSEINDNSLVLFDEPELSLHPEWQIELVSLLQDVFSEYPSCHFILASHSHYLVSSLPPSSSSILKMSMENAKPRYKSEMIKYSTYAWSAESVIYEVFGLRTSRNYYFANDLIHLEKLINKETRSAKETSEAKRLAGKLCAYVLHHEDPLNNYLKEIEKRLRKA